MREGLGEVVQRAVATYRVAETFGNWGTLKTPVVATARTPLAPAGPFHGALNSYRLTPAGRGGPNPGHRP